MRAYFFVNSALSGIQKGLQVAHCVAEMSTKDPEDQWQRDKSVFETWRDYHKTIIVLEGGFHADLMEIADSFQGNYDYCWEAFREDEETMNGMMTAVGIILPERIYKAAEVVRKSHVNLDLDSPDERVHEVVEEFKITEWEADLIKLLNSCPLAR
jgi:hypothetical protein